MTTAEKTMIPMSIRVEADLHAFISNAAKTENRSMTYIINRLLRKVIPSTDEVVSEKTQNVKAIRLESGV